MYAKERKNDMKNVHIMYLKIIIRREKNLKVDGKMKFLRRNKKQEICLACVEALKIIALAASPLRSSENDNKGTNTCEIRFPKIFIF